MIDAIARTYRQVGWFVMPLVIAAAIVVASFGMGAYQVHLATSWVAFGLVAFGLDLVWGKGGDLSLGHTTFYGIGGYIYGIVAINLAPVLGSTVLVAVIAAPIAGALVAGAVGYFLFYGRLGPLQTTIITYTFTLILYTVAVGLTVNVGEAYVGGDNGMTGIPSLALGLDPEGGPLSRHGALLTAIAIATATYLAARALLRAPFGMVIDGTRMDLLRTELLGYDVRAYRMALFALSGAVAGMAGGIFASWANYISPEVFGITQALLVPIYVLVGGRGTLVGAFFGAVFVGGSSFWLGSGVVGGQTTLVLGILLIVIVILLPAGILGSARDGIRALLRRFDALPAAAAPPLDGPVEDISATGRGSTETVLETRQLTKTFGGVVASDRVDLAFQGRGIHCLIGPNGAGKSTFLKCCLGLEKPDEGTVLLTGEDVTRWQPFRRVRGGLGIKLQVARVFEGMRAWDNLWIAAYAQLRDRASANARVRRVIEEIGMRDKAHLSAGQLSHGEQQWLDIGMVLCLDPKVIILDEPTAGMTSQETQKTATMLRRLADHAGIVVVEHDMEFVRMLDAPVTVLHQGGVFAQGRIEDLRQDERILDIYLGRRHRA